MKSNEGRERGDSSDDEKDSGEKESGRATKNREGREKINIVRSLMQGTIIIGSWMPIDFLKPVER